MFGVSWFIMDKVLNAITAIANDLLKTIGALFLINIIRYI
jgi:hypothetical protein